MVLVTLCVFCASRFYSHLKRMVLAESISDTSLFLQLLTASSKGAHWGRPEVKERV